MSLRFRLRNKVVNALLLIVCAGANSQAHAQDLTHAVRGIIKHVDKDAKTVIIKTDDGVEHTIHYTDKTAVNTGHAADRVAVDTYLGSKDGGRVVVRYTEKGGEKTAVAVKDATEGTGKTLK
jgi:hypothetical protein